MDEQQKQLVAKLKDAQNVLVTVSKNPSVDQLAAAIGLTLALNKLDKHATAVYSGQTPSTIEFLKPEETLETNTDSLRDFIIALDKSKADKLRYKVEDQVVRIFITPYRTSISENDLEFSQGDFNVDVVIALGVQEQTDLDDAIQAHGRILHDAVVATLSIADKPELGTLNIVDNEASSLSEMVTRLIQSLDKSVLDTQIATALLTGIVAMTERFSNDRTSPETMSISANLMSAGANQQLIATELDAELAPEPQTASTATPAAEAGHTDPGTLAIDHGEHDPPTELPPVSSSTHESEEEITEDEQPPEQPRSAAPQIQVDENGQLISGDEDSHPKIGVVHSQSDSLPRDSGAESAVTRDRVVEPPMLGGELTANTSEEELGGSSEDLGTPAQNTPILSHNERVITPSPNKEVPEPSEQPEQPSQHMTVSPLPPVAPIVPAAPTPPEIPEPIPPTPSVQDIVSATTQQSPVPDTPVQPSLPQISQLPDLPQPPAMPALTPMDTDNTNEEYIDTARQTLSDIEHVVDSPHISAMTDDNSAVDTPEADIDAARKAVEQALASQPAQTNPDPIVALNAQPLGSQLREKPASDTTYQPAPGFGLPVTEANEPVSNTSAPDSTDNLLLPGLQSPQSVASTAIPATAAPVSAFPGTPPPQSDKEQAPPPPVPPPPIFPTA